MMIGRTWNPLHELEALRQEVQRAFDDHRMNQPWWYRPRPVAGRYPLMNVLHDADNVYVEVLAPGLNPESIQVSVLQGILQVSGDKQALSDLIKPEAFHRAERGGGRFSRSLTLPCEVDAAKVRAEYRSGILTVTLAKAEAAKPRRVVVKVQ